MMQLALNGLFRARWSAHVHEEWMRAVLEDRPDIPAERLRGIRAAMDREAQDSADVIVTRNLRDFPDDTLALYNVEAQHPDEFVCHLIDLAPVSVLDAVREQQARLINPPVTMPELLAAFERLGLVATVFELRRLMNL